MLSMISIPEVPHVYLYPKPINMQFGEVKLIELCTNVMGLDPFNGYVFLFFNQRQDKLKLFYLDETGSHEITKLLYKGGFLLPVAKSNQNFIKLESSILPSLFRLQEEW